MGLSDSVVMSACGLANQISEKHIEELVTVESFLRMHFCDGFGDRVHIEVYKILNFVYGIFTFQRNIICLVISMK